MPTVRLYAFNAHACVRARMYERVHESEHVACTSKPVWLSQSQWLTQTASHDKKQGKTEENISCIYTITLKFREKKNSKRQYVYM